MFQGPATRSPCFLRSVCGDGKTLDDEECDDANQIDGDGCNRICRIEKGFECVTPTSFTVSGCGPIIGDGLRRPPEECDDGNLEDEDGCSNGKIDPWSPGGAARVEYSIEN